MLNIEAQLHSGGDFVDILAARASGPHKCLLEFVFVKDQIGRYGEHDVGLGFLGRASPGELRDGAALRR